MVKKKEIKKREEQKKRELEESLKFKHSTKSLIYNIVGVVGIFLIFYFITVAITNGIVGLHEKEPDDTATIIQYDEILAGEVFNMSDSEYYVLFYDFNGDHAEYYDTLVSLSESKIYTVDIGSAFNSYVVSDEGNMSVQKASDLKIKEATIVKIKDGKNISYLEGRLIEIKEGLN